MSIDWDDPTQFPDAPDAPDAPGPMSLLDCPEPGCDFQTVSPSGLKRHQTRTHGAEPAGHSRPAAASDPEPAPEMQETAPSPPRAPPARRGRFGRLQGTHRQAKRADSPSAARPTRTPKVTRGKRISIAADISDFYFGVGRQLEHTPHYPAGRMLTYQAPAAGVILDDALKNTLLDTMVVQPIWRAKDKWEDVLYLGAPPVLLILMQNIRIRQQVAMEAGDHDEARRLEGALQAEGRMLTWMLRSSLIRLAPAMAEARKRAEEEDKIIRDAFPELPPGDDPVRVLLDSLFAPPGTMTAPPEPAATTEESDNVGYVYAE